MTSPRDIARGSHAHNSVSYSLSNSPTMAFHSPPASGSYLTGSSLPHRATPGGATGAPLGKQLKPFNTEDIKILLLENVNQTGRDILTAQGYQVEFLKTSLPEDQLIEKIR